MKSKLKEIKEIDKLLDSNITNITYEMNIAQETFEIFLLESENLKVYTQNSIYNFIGLSTGFIGAVFSSFLAINFLFLIFLTLFIFSVVSFMIDEIINFYNLIDFKNHLLSLSEKSLILFHKKITNYLEEIEVNFDSFELYFIDMFKNKLDTHIDMIENKAITINKKNYVNNFLLLISFIDFQKIK